MNRKILTKTRREAARGARNDEAGCEPQSTDTRMRSAQGGATRRRSTSSAGDFAARHIVAINPASAPRATRAAQAMIETSFRAR